MLLILLVNCVVVFLEGVYVAHLVSYMCFLGIYVAHLVS